MADRQQKTALFFSAPACFATRRIIQKSPAESWDLHILSFQERRLHMYEITVFYCKVLSRCASRGFNQSINGFCGV